MMTYQLETKVFEQYYRYAQMYFPLLCQPRSEESNKGTFGTLAVYGGSSGMSGALVLCGSAALKSGCGKVWLGFNQASLPLPVISEYPEIMLATAEILQQRQDISAHVIGCGLGTDESAKNLLQFILSHTNQPLLLDADALNLLALFPELWNDLTSSQLKSSAIILTPHPGEAARLLHCTPADIQNNRIAAGLQLAERYQSWIVLKGHHSLIISPTGQLYQNLSGNAGLATAGSGDVLSGIIGSLLAQKISLSDAIKIGVWLHGIAAELLKANGVGPIGLCASEIANAVRWLRNQFAYNGSA